MSNLVSKLVLVFIEAKMVKAFLEAREFAVALGFEKANSRTL